MRVAAASLYAVSLAAMACTPTTEPADLPELTVEAPVNTVELLPGGQVDFLWSVTGGDGRLTIDVDALTLPIPPVPVFDEVVSEGSGSFTWSGDDMAGGLVPPDIYDLVFTLSVAGEEVGVETRGVAVHGIRWVEPSGSTIVRGSDLPVEFRFVTVSLRELALATSLDVNPNVTNDDRTVDVRTTIPEFAATERIITFRGQDVLGTNIPAGSYALVVDASDPDSALSYRVGAGQVDWRPAQ